VQILKFLIPMKVLKRQVKLALLYFGLALCVIPAVAQVKTSPRQLKDFNKDLVDAGLTFTLPAGFREIKGANNEDLSCDYAIEIPDAEFEIWFQVRSLKDNRPFIKLKDKQVIPDSLYMEMGRTQTTTLIGDKSYLIRSIPHYSLARYNADAGKTFLLNLPDSPTTKHYKYAMVVVLQKNHAGTLIATCFANELGPGFFKNLNSASSCIKFNP